MQLHRFYCKSISEPTSVLPDTEAHHAASVLRLARGDKVELFDGKGAVAQAVIEQISANQVKLQVQQRHRYQRPAGPQIIIAVSIPKGRRLDWLIGKCTELGVDRIVPAIFERTVKQPKNPKALQRWNSVTISAAKQCRRIFLPRIDAPTALADALRTLKTDYPKAMMLLGSLSQDAPSIATIELGDNDLIALIGPEGGITEDEQKLLSQSGAKAVRLTNTILRVETAALAFATVLAARRDAKSAEQRK